MNWFRENKFLGIFLVAFGVGTLIALFLLFRAKSKFNEATVQLNETVTERNRLHALNPFPNESNLAAMKTQAADYGIAIEKMKDQLKARVLPVTPLAPNEFQTRLRQAVTAVTEKARTNRVRLPENFFLGFEEFRAALPSNTAAPLLGQQLAQVELLTNILIDARIDALTAFRREALTEEGAAAAGATPTPTQGRRGRTTAGTEPNLVQRTVIEATFASTPTAARRVLNQIASATQQFFIIRTLHVLNEKEKGPPRVQAANPTNVTITAVPSEPKPAAALSFIVGTEHIQMTANIELVTFRF